MSNNIAALIDYFASLITSPMKPQRRMMALELASERLQQTARVETSRGTMRFVCSSARALHDPLAFHYSEPETVAWIDDWIKPGEVLWDVGANIGVYTIYGALADGVRVIAFEPSAASFGALVGNIEINQMGSRVQAFCLALADRTGIDYLHMSDTSVGQSMHAFGQLETVGGIVAPAFSQAVPGIAIDDACSIFGIDRPDHIKLDVDGTEEKILRGGSRTLSEVRTVSMEVSGESGRAAANFLQEAGFFRVGDLASAARNQLFVNRSKVSVP